MKIGRLNWIALAASLAAASALAQEPKVGVAELTGVVGNVLVSTPTGLTAGFESMRLVEGTRVITTNKSAATVLYDDGSGKGCKVDLKENQRFLVVQKPSDKPCATLVAQAQSILQTPEGSAVAVTAGAGLTYAAVVPVVGALAGLAALQKQRENQAVSPN